jgi:hypothetical protein
MKDESTFLKDFDYLYSQLPIELEEEISSNILHKIEDLFEYYNDKEVFFSEEEKLDLQQVILQKYRIQIDNLLHEKILLK